MFQVSIYQTKSSYILVPKPSEASLNRHVCTSIYGQARKTCLGHVKFMMICHLWVCRRLNIIRVKNGGTVKFNKCMQELHVGVGTNSSAFFNVVKSPSSPKVVPKFP